MSMGMGGPPWRHLRSDRSVIENAEATAFVGVSVVGAAGQVRRRTPHSEVTHEGVAAVVDRPDGALGRKGVFPTAANLRNPSTSSSSSRPRLTSTWPIMPMNTGPGSARSRPGPGARTQQAGRPRGTTGRIGLSGRSACDGHGRCPRPARSQLGVRCRDIVGGSAGRALAQRGSVEARRGHGDEQDLAHHRADPVPDLLHCGRMTDRLAEHRRLARVPRRAAR